MLGVSGKFFFVALFVCGVIVASMNPFHILSHQSVLAALVVSLMAGPWLPSSIILMPVCLFICLFVCFHCT